LVPLNQGKPRFLLSTNKIRAVATVKRLHPPPLNAKQTFEKHEREDGQGVMSQLQKISRDTKQLKIQPYF